MPKAIIPRKHTDANPNKQSQEQLFLEGFSGPVTNVINICAYVHRTARERNVVLWDNIVHPKGSHRSNHAGPLHLAAGNQDYQATAQIYVFVASSPGANGFMNDVREANSAGSVLVLESSSLGHLSQKVLYIPIFFSFSKQQPYLLKLFHFT